MTAVDVTDTLHDAIANIVALKAAIRGTEMGDSDREALIRLVDITKSKITVAASAIESNREGNGFKLAFYNHPEDTNGHSIPPDSLVVFQETGQTYTTHQPEA